MKGKLRFSRLLKGRGFYVRMHAYEFLVGNYRNFVALVLVEPYKNRVLVRKLEGTEEEISHIISAILDVEPLARVMLWEGSDRRGVS